jgi:hypothetical protein
MLTELTKWLICKFWEIIVKMNVCILWHKLKNYGVKIFVLMSCEIFNYIIKINWSKIIGWEYC